MGEASALRCGKPMYFVHVRDTNASNQSSYWQLIFSELADESGVVAVLQHVNAYEIRSAAKASTSGRL